MPPHLREDGWIKEDGQVVVLNTGAGIKYPKTIEIDVPVFQKKENIIRS
ncbi:hypothetical protein [Sporosarcina sp. P2]|nr:hypothetical protein [Sporosarcina sp. P2]